MAMVDVIVDRGVVNLWGALVSNSSFRVRGTLGEGERGRGLASLRPFAFLEGATQFRMFFASNTQRQDRYQATSGCTK
jgi:hypothetical protein